MEMPSGKLITKYQKSVLRFYCLSLHMSLQHALFQLLLRFLRIPQQVEGKGCIYDLS